MRRMDLPRDDARRYFDYVDGKLIWKKRPRSEFLKDADWKNWNTKFPGSPAGSSDGRGYVTFAITVTGDKRKYLLHRVVWSWHNGPTELEVDHRDNDPSNNRIENLREATGSQNKVNRRQFRDATCNFIGVSYEAGRKRWKAGIRKGGGDTITLGRFKCATAAALAYDKAAIAEFGEFARLNIAKGQQRMMEHG